MSFIRPQCGFNVVAYSPSGCIKTSIYGSENVINAALEFEVKKVRVSTVKTNSPINLFRATKLASDKLFVAANDIKGRKAIVFFVERYRSVIVNQKMRDVDFLE